MKNKSFEDWMTKTNEWLAKICGCISDDLPDAAYYDMFENGLTPREAATQALNDGLNLVL